MLHNLQLFHFNIHLLFFYLLLFSLIMRIDDLFVISIHLSEHRIQFSRKIIHAFVDLQNAKKKKEKKKTKRAKWKSTQRCVFQICYRVSICWLHHKSTSINVVNSEDQNIDENQLIATFFKSLSIQYADYIIKLHR